MKSLSKFLLLWLTLSLSMTLSAQTEYGAFTATGSANPINMVSDYQCLGINPANLGWSADNRQVHFGFGGVGVSFFTNAVTRNDISALFKDNQYTLQEKIAAALRYSDSKTSTDLSLNSFGIAIQSEKYGGFAFSVRDRASFTMQLNKMAAELIWLGANSDYFDQKIYDANNVLVGAVSTSPQPVASLFKGTNFSSYWIRDFQIGYGKTLFKTDEWDISGGIGIKIARGYSWVDVIVDDQRIYAYNAMSPVFQIDYNTPSPSSLPDDGKPRPVGRGFGLDLGFSAQIANQVRLGFSINDIGGLKWDGNVYRASYEAQIKKITTTGLGNEQLPDVFEAIVIEDELFKWEGIDQVKVKYPSQLRMGAAWIGTPDLAIGSEVVFPLVKAPGSLPRPVIGVGLQFTPGDVVLLSAGLQAGGGYDFHIPFSIGFKPLPGWEFGFGTRDITIAFTKKSPNFSLAMGFLRFSFGKYKQEQE
ncbi:MAG: DUF5723 family protein [Bacteroidales bacterium]